MNSIDWVCVGSGAYSFRFCIDRVDACCPPRAPPSTHCAASTSPPCNLALPLPPPRYKCAFWTAPHPALSMFCSVLFCSVLFCSVLFCSPRPGPSTSGSTAGMPQGWPPLRTCGWARAWVGPRGVGGLSARDRVLLFWWLLAASDPACGAPRGRGVACGPATQRSVSVRGSSSAQGGCVRARARSSREVREGLRRKGSQSALRRLAGRDGVQHSLTVSGRSGRMCCLRRARPRPVQHAVDDAQGDVELVRDGLGLCKCQQRVGVALHLEDMCVGICVWVWV
ncbi:hypothetical protein CALCODRAFT_57743 [Calocera cornea HHB12733]|uniref:Uncharacterized protein n=1 Tax=Calocera cornea HHB12733 TaxID=1353952 RepID=A0A165IVC4_9BASI|nr:hypothetical protein CALCODRAFT_57743 [Calocera cornea HHB12733]